MESSTTSPLVRGNVRPQPTDAFANVERKLEDRIQDAKHALDAKVAATIKMLTEDAHLPGDAAAIVVTSWVAQMLGAPNERTLSEIEGILRDGAMPVLAFEDDEFTIGIPFHRELDASGVTLAEALDSFTVKVANRE